MEQILIEPDSEILVGRGLPEPLLAGNWDKRSCAVLAQEPVEEVAGAVIEAIERLGARAHLRMLPDREAAKEMATITAAYEWMAAIGLDRDAAVVGVGGGALTDASGFLAATWMRGVASFYVPTTLLGAVDASIGGKTGINVGGKNLVGAFWMPRRVIVDLDILDQLGPGLLREGAAEILKAGLLADPGIVAGYRESGLDFPLESLVARAIGIKAQLVSEDFTERGKRALLNLGHTVGHAVEFASGISHGEAVAIGLVAASAISEQLTGFTQTAAVTECLERLGLPTSSPAGLDRSHVADLIRLDKKRAGGDTIMVLLEAVGRPVLRPVSQADLEVGLGAVGL